MMNRRTLKVRLALICGVVGSAIFLMLARDLFYAFSWQSRKTVGALIFCGIVYAFGRRLWTVRPGDDRPLEDPKSPPGRAGFWAGWVLALVVASLIYPLTSHPGGLARGDWTYYAAKYEAARRSIVDYRQFPWWDPWTRGGYPLAGNPLCGVAGVAMPLVLAFGTLKGLQLAIVAGFLLAAEGTRRLAGLWLRDPIAGAAAGLIYAINGGVIMSSSAAYDIPMGYAVLPWMLYYVFQLDRRPWAGVGLGFWAAFNVLNGIAYFTVYVVLIAAVVWLRVLRAREGIARRRVFVNTILALGVSLALAGWRIATTLLVGLDYPRVLTSGMSMDLKHMTVYLILRPGAYALTTIEAPYFWECGWTIGPVVLLLVGASLLRGWRWWHTLAAVCGWLALGAFQWYEASYWLAHLPIFSSMHVSPRWRFMAALGVALAAASTLEFWRASGSRRLVRLANVALAVIALDYVAYGFEALPIAFSVPANESMFPKPRLRRGEFAQVRNNDEYAAVSGGYGVVQALEPLLGYDRYRVTNRRWRGHREYKGEFWTDRGPLVPIFWSPNRVVLAARPGEMVYVNQNPGSWWLVNGRHPPEFAGWRCVETTRDFAIRADDQGQVVLEIAPRGLEAGWKLHLLGIGLIALAGAGWRSWAVREPIAQRHAGTPLSAGVSTENAIL